MLDFNNKELIHSFVISDLRQDRSHSKREIILGRTYTKFGIACATTMVTDCWKVYDPSVEQYKYVYLSGVARQHPEDINIKYSDGVELAHEMAFANPVMKFVYNKPASYENIELMMWQYIAGLPVEFVKTQKEVDFIRNGKHK